MKKLESGFIVKMHHSKKLHFKLLTENISVQFLLDTNALFPILKSLILAFIIKSCRNLVLTFDKDGREVYLEVKTTKVNRTDFSFIITKNEL